VLRRKPKLTSNVNRPPGPPTTGSNTTFNLVAGVILLAAATLAAYGMTRTLWLDEAWVANSVLERTWSGMFYYPDWLQTTPPLFLALERAVTGLLGPSNLAFRLYPAAAAVAGVALFLMLARRVLPPALAALVCAVLACHPIAIEYARTVKQYSGEIAASSALLLAAVAYVENPTRRRFALFAALTAIALPLAYSSVFLIPGLVCAVHLAERNRRTMARATARAAWLSGIAVAILAALYLVFIRPNYSPVLREFWAINARADSGGVLVIAAVVLCAALAGRAVSRIRASADRRAFLEIVCALPCLLLAASAALGWYPSSPRTRLFALPCFLLLLGMLAQEMLDRLPRPVWRTVAAAAWLIAIALPALTVWRQVRDRRNLPEEDMAAALTYLRQHGTPNDLVLVHASVKEDFKLYADVLYSQAAGGHAWTRPPVFGDTGWPCCVRGHLEGPHASSSAAVFADLDAKVPRDFRGRIWLLYSTRPTQWDYTGLDEGKLWRMHIWDRGCPPEPYYAPENIGVSPMNCAR
jgi:hypothetical protein